MLQISEFELLSNLNATETPLESQQSKFQTFFIQPIDHFLCITGASLIYRTSILHNDIFFFTA